ncbi:hypothetical protein CTAYLR_000625 [Chrysophaeum taylorii]|uniref:Uncharacterized protein n=1 Tax=Chrysophaeum taylorii TaxID=2483200 RepID=A0AAD7XGB7_9STRA|nr:hypothetical protein CTAYLR_000625 [Chrysophaeum taylorii]
MEDLLCCDPTLFFEDPKPPTRRRRRGWSPDFHDIVDRNVREFTLETRTGRVSVSLAYRENGTGSTVWDAAIVLAKYVDTLDLRGLRVVELGSGTGLVGLVAAAGGARVLLTDLPECLDFLRANAKGTAAVAELAWGETRDLPPADIVLCADCLLPGATHLFKPLADTIVAFLRSRESCVAILAYEHR